MNDCMILWVYDAASFQLPRCVSCSDLSIPNSQGQPAGFLSVFLLSLFLPKTPEKSNYRQGRSKKWVRGLGGDRAELALPCGRAQQGEQGRALQSLHPFSTLLPSQQFWETILEEVRKFLQQQEMKIFRNFSSVRCTFFLFLSLFFLNGICCLNISVPLSPFLFCS